MKLAADWLEPDNTILINCINVFRSSSKRIRFYWQIVQKGFLFWIWRTHSFEEFWFANRIIFISVLIRQVCSNASLHFCDDFTASHYWAAGECRGQKKTYKAKFWPILQIGADRAEWRGLGVVGSEGNVSSWNVRRRIQSKGKLRIELQYYGVSLMLDRAGDWGLKVQNLI